MASFFKCSCLGDVLGSLRTVLPLAKAEDESDTDDEVNLVGKVGIEEELLRKLVIDLESIHETRSADDRELLTKLVAEHEETHGKLLITANTSDWPDLTAFGAGKDDPYKMLPLPEGDTASLLDGTTLALLVQHLQRNPDRPLHPKWLAQLLDCAKRMHERNSDRFGPVMSVNIPGVALPSGAIVRRSDQRRSEGTPKIVVLGDTHGQLGDVLWALSECGMPSESTLYVFNGDVADRSYRATEIFALLFTMMLQFSDADGHTAVVLNRGNHECLTLNGSRCGGFRDELLMKYEHEVGAWLHQKFGDVFAVLPLATVIQESIIVIHGGVGSVPETHLDTLRGLQWDVREPTLNPWGIQGDTQIDALMDAVWSDPGDEPGSLVNPRGHGHIWGPDYTDRFLKANGLQLIVRSHQVPKDRTGVFTHEAHGGRLLTLFSASNYSMMGNSAGGLIFTSSGTELEYCVVDFGVRDSDWSEIEKLSIVDLDEPSSPKRVSRGGLKYGSSSSTNSNQTTLHGELLQSVMGLIVEFRVPLWDACTAHDKDLLGQVGLHAWERACKATTNIHEVDWILIARLLGQCSVNHVRYMDLLNRFGFHIGSEIVDKSMAEGILAQIYETIMRADDSLQQLLGRLCHGASRRMPAQELLSAFREILDRNGISASGISAVVRSLESHIGTSSKSTVDVAEFLSAWKCGAGIRPNLATPGQRNFAAAASRLLTAPKKAKGAQKRRLSTYATASAGQLMDFFTAADIAGDGFMSLAEGEAALKSLIKEHAWDIDTKDICGVLQAADVTNRGSLNYLEFIRIFDFHEAKNLTNQNVLDSLCLRIWLHRNALSTLYRHIGHAGKVSQDQISWSLRALDRIVDGQLDDELISTLVGAVAFVDGMIPAEKFLRSFDIFDSHK